MLSKYMFRAIVIALVSGVSAQDEERTSGRIEYTNGGTQIFEYIELIWYSHSPYRPETPSDYLTVYYDSSWHDIPFNKLKSLTVLEYELPLGPHFGRILNALIEVTTKTGVKVKYQLTEILGIKIQILDDLTGEKTNPWIPFGVTNDEEVALNIKRIIWD